MIGKRLAELRKLQKMKQEELARILGVSKHSVSMYENNKSSPTDDSYVLLAKTFNVSIDYLMGLVDTPYPYVRDEYSSIKIPDTIPPEFKIMFQEFIEYLQKKYDPK